ncbi:hypothetical protein FsymDg_1086 [Candidatus Protofrankia datiscae]|uniref:Uncharacterized protein n=1 Tax=Candidatus Protofrankia datiscae TaxID=2716812 RepID=F8AYT1_9ACTN|nr:hypothetical protein FsymDg_1086 [Candidatus Protofrankia datiscae]
MIPAWGSAASGIARGVLAELFHLAVEPCSAWPWSQCGIGAG